jgi:hypothetical protein
VDHRPQKPTGESRKSQEAQNGNGISTSHDSKVALVSVPEWSWRFCSGNAMTTSN